MLLTLKKLKGRIVFGSSMRSSLLASVTVFMPTVTFEPLKIVLKFHLWILYIKKSWPVFFFSSVLSPIVKLWPFENILEKNLMSTISRKVFKLELETWSADRK